MLLLQIRARDRGFVRCTCPHCDFSVQLWDGGNLAWRGHHDGSAYVRFPRLQGHTCNRAIGAWVAPADGPHAFDDADQVLEWV